MFGKLKEKLKSWTKGLSNKADAEPEEIEETKEAEIKEKIPKAPETKSKKQGRKEKKLEEKEKKKEAKKEKKKSKDKLKEEIEEIEEISKEIPKLPKEENTPEEQNEIHEIEETKTFSEISETKPEDDVKYIGENQKEVITGEKEKPKKSFFGKLTSKINKVKISEEDFEQYSEELEMLLVENNVAYEVVEKIIKDLKERIVGKEFLKKEIEGQIEETLKDVIYDVLIEPFDLFLKIKQTEKRPFVILFCGINGTGKTTTIAKITDMLKKKNLSCIWAAGDTFRAASIEQLKKHGEKLDVKVISHEYGSDPASVGFDAIKYAEKNNIDVVLIDTAGRMHTEKNLMAQIEKVSKVTKPNLKIFVGESTTGNDIVEQVKAFNDSVGLDGIILSKADIDEKGGTALSVGYITKKPILYLGTGQEYKDLEQFNKNKFVESLGL